MAPIFEQDPNYPAFRRRYLHDTGKGQHARDSLSLSINMQYRAIYVVDDDGQNVWYWIGSHADYDKFVG